jgi:26S proteasome regulatory subunit N6
LARYKESLSLLTTLLREVRRLDDKALLVEIQLIESRVQHALRNLPKARAALTGARTAANAIYCPPLLQAQIDTRSGVLHAEEKDFKTAYSYFFEAFEAFDSLDAEADALSSLKYMLLCKIMGNQPKDAHAIVNGKLALKYAGRQIEAMSAVAAAHERRSLHEFQRAKERFAAELQDDRFVAAHLDALYGSVLEQNLCRLIEPFSCVEVAHIAELIDIDAALVEKKLSQMILDQRCHAVLDQGAGWLIVYDEAKADQLYPAALDTLQSMNKVVDALNQKAHRLNH